MTVPAQAPPQMSRPTVRVPIPPGWRFKESYTVLAADGKANVIVSSETVSADSSVETYAADQAELLNDFPGYHLLEEDPNIRLEGLADHATLRKFTWQPEERDSSPVTQLQLYAKPSAGRGITATATARSVDFDGVEGELLSILLRVVVDSRASASLDAVVLGPVGTSPPNSDLATQ